MKIGYLIPEFPGQTHIWMWREIVHMREFGFGITIFSTRRPTERDRARHEFAKLAQKTTVYLWPNSFAELMGGLLWAVATSPGGAMRCLKLAILLPVEKPLGWKALLPLIVPACFLARALNRRGIKHLHVHSCANSAILAMMVKQLTGTPYSLTLNANVDWWGGAMAEKFANADFTITHTGWLFEQLKRD